MKPHIWRDKDARATAWADWKHLSLFQVPIVTLCSAGPRRHEAKGYVLIYTSAFMSIAAFSVTNLPPLSKRVQAVLPICSWAVGSSPGTRALSSWRSYVGNACSSCTLTLSHAAGRDELEMSSTSDACMSSSGRVGRWTAAIGSSTSGPWDRGTWVLKKPDLDFLQVAGGQLPSARAHPCAVGVEGDIPHRWHYHNHVLDVRGVRV